MRQVLADARLDAMLVTDLINIRYLTGFTGSNAALLVAASGDADSLFCTDFRYAEQASREVPDLVTVIGRASDRAVVRRAPGRVGFESHVVTVQQHGELAAAAAAGTVLAPVAGPVEKLRAVKDASEIAALRAACGIADRALADLVEAGGIRAGRSEREVGLDLDERMRRLGSDDVAFPTILAAGPNSAIPHHRPGERELAAGDLVKVDFGAVVDGYHSDMTRMFVLGTVAGWQSDLHALVAAAQRAGRDAAKAGARLADVDAAARGVITAAGFGEQFGHGLGHGIGLQVHEAPYLAASAAGIMAPDMVVTVEPGIYLPGRGGVRIEDSGVVAPDGYVPLTLAPRELLVL